jgi:hypothetical protein
VAVHGDPGFAEVLSAGEFDIAFVPHYAADRYRYPGAAVGVNIASFQEMTAAEVGGYARLLSTHGCKAVYSLNRSRSPYNTQLESVEGELSRYYRCEAVRVLDTPYTAIDKKTKDKPGREKDREGEDLSYRHVVGRLPARQDPPTP